MEAACRRTSYSLHFQSPRTPHAAAVIVRALAFHTKDADGIGDALNIFLFPDLSPSAGSEVALLTLEWYAILGGGTLTSFADMSLLMGTKRSPLSQAGTRQRPNSRIGPSFAQFPWEIMGSTPPRTRCYSSLRRHPGSARD